MKNNELRWMLHDSDGWAIRSYSTKASAIRAAKKIGGSVNSFSIGKMIASVMKVSA